MTWTEFVKKIQSEGGISYKEALVKASPLWKKHKAKDGKTAKKKKRAKKKTVKVAPEISEFPKIKKKNDAGHSLFVDKPSSSRGICLQSEVSLKSVCKATEWHLSFIFVIFQQNRHLKTIS